MSTWLIYDPVEIDVECKEVALGGRAVCEYETGHDGPHSFYSDLRNKLYVGSTSGINTSSIKAHTSTGTAPVDGDIIFNDEGKPIGVWHEGRVITTGYAPATGSTLTYDSATSGWLPTPAPTTSGATTAGWTTSGGMMSVGSEYTAPRLFDPDAGEKLSKNLSSGIKFV